MASTHDLIRDMEATAKALNVSPSTLGEKTGQGGQFYARLQNGKRCWPETISKVQRGLRIMRETGDVNLPEGWRDTSHGSANANVQGPAPDRGAA